MGYGAITPIELPASWPNLIHLHVKPKCLLIFRKAFNRNKYLFCI